MPSPSEFAYYLNIILPGSHSDQAHTWQIAITAFFVSVVDSFVAVAPDSVFMSNTADSRIAEEESGVLVSWFEPSARWMGNLGLFANIQVTSYGHALVYDAFTFSKNVE